MVGGADTFLAAFCVGMDGGARIRGIGVLSVRVAPGIVGPAISGVGSTGEGMLGLLSGRPFMTAAGNCPPGKLLLVDVLFRSSNCMEVPGGTGLLFWSGDGGEGGVNAGLLCSTGRMYDCAGLVVTTGAVAGGVVCFTGAVVVAAIGLV